MRIEIKGKAIFEFSSEDYFLCENKETNFEDERYSLNPRIDRSEKGKSDDIGCPVIYISKEEAEALFKSGFSKTY